MRARSRDFADHDGYLDRNRPFLLFEGEVPTDLAAARRLVIYLKIFCIVSVQIAIIEVIFQQNLILMF
jgi:hypothetical protein